MTVVRPGVALLLAALVMSRGLFAQDGGAPPPAPAAAPDTLEQVPAALTATPADEVKVLLRPVEIRYVQQEAVLLPATRSIKALYVNAWAFGSPKLWQLVRLADETEINAIARLVVAKDPLLAVRKPQWSVKDKETGGQWRDRIHSAWVDAYNDSVWIYSAELAREAVSMGFREVQFDYVRFPDEPRERMATAIFPAHRAGQTQREAVREHVALLSDRLRPLGVPVTFDIFGLTASATGDLGIGQVWEDFVGVADVVLPMVYPSHYYRGAFGYAWPNGQPYRVVRSALVDALERSRPLPGSAEIRPFLQAFTLGRRLPRYTPFEIREQIRAAEDLGITSWVLWNPRSVYQRGALRPKHALSGADAPAPVDVANTPSSR